MTYRVLLTETVSGEPVLRGFTLNVRQLLA